MQVLSKLLIVKENEEINNDDNNKSKKLWMNAFIKYNTNNSQATLT